MTWKNRIVARGLAHPDEFLANPLNFRIHPRYQQDAVAALLGEVGWVQSVVVNRVTGHLIDGHLRVLLADRVGETEVPVTYVELSEDEEKLILAAFDAVGALASTQDDKLDALLGSVETQSDDLRAVLDDLESRLHVKARGGTAKVKRDALRVDLVKVSLGAYRFFVPVAAYEVWLQAIRDEVGASGTALEDALLKRAGLHVD